MHIKQILDFFINNIAKDEDWVFSGFDCSEIGQRNMRVFPISMSELSHQYEDIIVEALIKCEKLINKKWGNDKYIFYCWFDEMSSRLCFSALPENCKLPFTCKVKITDSIREIVQLSMVSSSLLDWSEFEEIEFEENDEKENTEEYILTVLSHRCCPARND